MRNKWIKRFFPLIVLLLLAPWPVAYAHAYDDDMAGQDGVLASQPHHDGNRRVKTSQRHNGLVGSHSRMEAGTVQVIAKLKSNSSSNNNVYI